MPDGLNVAGPVQVNQTINNTDAISKEFSLLNQRGSQVVQGALQIIPVKDSLLYIQPSTWCPRTVTSRRCAS